MAMEAHATGVLSARTPRLRAGKAFELARRCTAPLLSANAAAANATAAAGQRRQCAMAPPLLLAGCCAELAAVQAWPAPITHIHIRPQVFRDGCKPWVAGAARETQGRQEGLLVNQRYL